MKSRAAVVLTLVVLSSGLLSAQPFGSDILAANIRTGGSGLVGDVLRVDNQGVITTFITSTVFTQFPNMVMMDNNNVDLVVLETNLGGSQDNLKIFDPSAKLGTTIKGPTGTNLNWFDRTGTGDFFAVGGSGVYIVKRDGSGWSTVKSGSPLGNLHSCVQDLSTGGVCVGDITSPTKAFLVALDGTITTTWALPMSPYSMTIDHRDGTIIAAGTRTVVSLHTDGSLTTITSSIATNPNAMTFDRWTGNGEIVVGSNPIIRMTTGGTVITTHAGIPPIANAGMCFDQGRNLACVRTGSPNKYDYNLNVSNQPNKGYVIAISITAFSPGVSIDSRVVQLTPDAFTFMTILGQFPFMKNNLGTLDAFGSNRLTQTTLDLSLLGSLLTGTKVWACAVTIDPAAPSGIGVITKPVVTILE